MFLSTSNQSINRLCILRIVAVCVVMVCYDNDFRLSWKPEMVITTNSQTDPDHAEMSHLSLPDLDLDNKSKHQHLPVRRKTRNKPHCSIHKNINM